MFATVPPGAEIFISSVKPWMTSIAALTTATNAVATGTPTLSFLLR
jgi:hypothetical protein